MILRLHVKGKAAFLVESCNEKLLQSSVLLRKLEETLIKANGCQVLENYLMDFQTVVNKFGYGKYL